MEKLIYALLSVKNKSDKLDSLLTEIKGISAGDLSVVSFEEIVAVAGEIHKASLVANNENAIEYAGVIEALAQQFTLLPVRFGSSMAADDSIRQMIERNYSDIQQNLQKVENKYEFGLKIFCDSEKMTAELQAKSVAETKTPGVPDPLIKNSVSRDWVNRKLKEHRLEELLLSYVDSVISEITEHLLQFNAVSKFKKMASPANIIDAVFLLGKDKKEALIHTISELQRKHASLTFVLTGPWPPYSFVDFTVK